MNSDKHLQALIAVSQSLAATTHPDAIKHLGRIANHLLRMSQLSGTGINSQDLSPLAKRILTKCAGQTLNSLAIAQACKKAHGGTSIKRAIKQLVARQLIQKTGASGATQYVIPASATKIEKTI